MYDLPVAGSPTQMIASFRASLPVSPFDGSKFSWFCSEPLLFTRCKFMVWPGIEMADVNADEDEALDMIIGELNLDDASELATVAAPKLVSPGSIICFGGK
ncbi:hypothetical protein OGATHE_004981 [Ogataea polymorpha]|uniref:Uncharacterized protein n=1 Tax=Ogataea polymorpha TaxID=460523 RepID=A0A9P8T001_9ASCO|nr:hypothetical protein OGATHE_004981 [Ogataea polymorpha]